MTKSWPLSIAVIYVVASVFIGPAIALGGYMVTPANGDFCDLRAHGGSEQRDHDYAVVAGIQIIGSTAMLAVGVFLLVCLWTISARSHWPVRLLLTTGILVMMAGYLVVLYMGVVANPRC
ncbi:hypothetical protein [Nocardia sp. CC227C]|uniref:hypothetical protein n=1 Tax=Nocardia sp. CC227C TaxID=3044562 RepID=UPI00278C7784|nr:hypothetical protein [Nocardia sp. CC227C]